MPEISVIIPVYNVALYLRDMIDSVLAQTFTDFELILVDDGSTDDSGAICDSYAGRDNRIRTIHKINGGVSSARNIGLDEAQGRWIAFLDADDYITPDYLSTLHKAAISTQADMAVCNILFCNLDGSKSSTPFIVSILLTGKHVRREFFSDERIKIQFYSPYNKIIRRECIGQLRFKHYAVGEDLLFIFELLGNIGSIAVVPLMGYYYIKREGSATTSRFSLKRIDYVRAAHEITELAHTTDNKVAEAATIWTMRHAINTLVQIYRNNIENECGEFINNEMKFVSDQSRQLRYVGRKQQLAFLILKYCPKLFRLI